LFHLAHDEVRPQETEAAAATAVGARLRSNAAAIVNRGSGAVSVTHLLLLQDDGENRNAWVEDFGACTG